MNKLQIKKFTVLKILILWSLSGTFLRKSFVFKLVKPKFSNFKLMSEYPR
jgi:hypothetical protein